MKELPVDESLSLIRITFQAGVLALQAVKESGSKLPDSKKKCLAVAVLRSGTALSFLWLLKDYRDSPETQVSGPAGKNFL